MISELLDPLNAGERLSTYIDLPERLGCPASGRDRLYPVWIDCIRCCETRIVLYTFCRGGINGEA
jgi:hypothetical protein